MSRIPVVVSLTRVVRAGDVNIGPTTASYRGSCLVQHSQNTHRIRETTIREAIRETIRETMLRETTTREIIRETVRETIRETIREIIRETIRETTIRETTQETTIRETTIRFERLVAVS